MKLKVFATFGLCTLAAILFLVSTKSQGQAVVVAKTKEQAIEDLVYANRILYNEGVLDAFGHISVRDPTDPTHFFMSKGNAPSLVTKADVIRYDMQCVAEGPQPNVGYGEKYIHCGVLRNRPDVNVVIHAHSDELIPYGLTKTPLRPVFLMGAWMPDPVPVFDIGDIQDGTNMMVTSNMFGDALAKALGKGSLVLMRGHGETVAGPDIQTTTVRAYYAVIDAKLETAALKLGTVKYLSPAEQAKAANGVGIGRPWEMFKARIGKIE
jgi:HCOMODA/2-hydroxy-3-carboxy-muconic semialdehyde decarboxylase